MSTSINILCYKSKMLANNEHPLILRVCKDENKKYVNLSISIKIQYWDSNKNESKPNCPTQ